MNLKNYAWAVNLTGWLALGIAVLQTIVLQIGLWHGHPFDPVIGLEISLMAMVGIVTSVLAHCLKRIEARLTKIESGRSD
jgi:hypothetical protein